MKIHVREIEVSPFKKGFIRLSADIEYEDNHVPETIWFDVEKKYKDVLSTSGNPWVVCLLPLAAYLDEEIVIDLPCDYQLLANLQEVMAVWNAWDKRRSKVVIKSPVALGAPPKERRRAAFFSGGVDSFFTVLKLDKEAKEAKNWPLTDLILVWGFDIPLENEHGFDSLFKRLERSAKTLQKNLIPVITNLRKTRFEEAGWAEYSHVAALSSVIYIIEKELDIAYLGSGHSYYDLISPWGSHPLVDNLFSGSTLKISLHGSAYKRVEKTELIASSENALAELHVCWQDASDKNCGCCNKCYRTMITLFILDALKKSSAFERNSLQLGEIERVYSNDESSIMLFKEIAEFAVLKQKPEISSAVLKSIQTSKRVNKLLPFVNMLKSNWPFRRLGVFFYKSMFKSLIYR